MKINMCTAINYQESRRVIYMYKMFNLDSYTVIYLVTLYANKPETKSPSRFRRLDLMQQVLPYEKLGADILYKFNEYGGIYIKSITFDAMSKLRKRGFENIHEDVLDVTEQLGGQVNIAEQ